MMFFRFMFRNMEEKYGQFVEDMMAAQARIESGDSDEEELLGPHGASIRIESTSDGGVRYSGSGVEGGIVGQRFPGTDERLPSYPEDAPFLPHTPASVTEFPKNGWRSISWHRVPEPTRLAAEIRVQLRDAG